MVIDMRFIISTHHIEDIIEDFVEEDFLQYFDYQKYIDRPCICTDYAIMLVNNQVISKDFFVYLKDEMHDWLYDNYIEYRLEYFDVNGEQTPWYLEIEDIELAILFKLTWM